MRSDLASSRVSGVEVVVVVVVVVVVFEIVVVVFVVDFGVDCSLSSVFWFKVGIWVGRRRWWGISISGVNVKVVRCGTEGRMRWVG